MRIAFTVPKQHTDVQSLSSCSLPLSEVRESPGLLALLIDRELLQQGMFCVQMWYGVNVYVTPGRYW